MRKVLVGAASALLMAGCGETASQERESSTAAAPARTAAVAPARREAPPVIVYRRVRYEGATLRVLTVRPDGTIHIDVPGGGAGGSQFDGRLSRSMLRGIRRDVARTPWRHLSPKRVRYDFSGAYFMFHYRGRDYVAMGDGMSPDLMPLTRRLNRVLSGGGQVEHRVTHRYARI